MRVYESDPTSVAAVGRETRAIGAVVGRTRAGQRAGEPDRSRHRGGQARDHAPAARARDPRRRPHAVRDAVQLVGRRPRRQAGGALLTRGLTSPSGTARISDEIVVQRNPDIIIAVPHGSPGAIPPGGLLPQQPELAQHERGRATAACTSPRATRCCSPTPHVAATIRDVRAQVPARTDLVARSSLGRRRRGRSTRGRSRRLRWRSARCDVPLADVWDSLTGQAAEGPLRQIIIELRLPRTVVGGRRRRRAGRRRRAAAGRARQPAGLAGRDRRHRRRGLRRDAEPCWCGRARSRCCRWPRWPSG